MRYSLSSTPDPPSLPHREQLFRGNQSVNFFQLKKWTAGIVSLNS
jgi:hypothetical protein